MDWQLPDIGKTIMYNIDSLKSVVSVNFRIWSKYVVWIPFPLIRNDLYIVV